MNREYQEDGLLLFQSSQRSTFNLHFVQLQFDRDKLYHRFWECHGEQIRSLIFDSCSYFTFATFKYIISQCPNVKHVSLICNYRIYQDLWWVPLADMNFTAESVSSFSCQVDMSPETEVLDILRSTLSCFPNLKELKIKLPNCYRDDKHGMRLPQYAYSRLGLLLTQSIPEGKQVLAYISQFIQTKNTKLKKLWLMQWDISSYWSNCIVNFSNVLSELKK